MSAEDVAVVRAVNEPYDGRDLAAALHDRLAKVDIEDREAVLESMRAFFAEEGTWAHLQEDLVWDGGLAGSVRGLDEFALFWPEWAGLWESYTARMVEYRDLGSWVLVPAAVEARGRGGIAVEMRVFQLFQVRDGKVAVMRAFASGEAALAAARA
jgi:hypothetical protein